MTLTAESITAPSALTGLGFTLPRSELAAALTTIGLGVGRRPVVPVLGGVLITCSAGTVTMSGYDFEQAVTVTIAGAATSDGCVLLGHRELSAVVQAAGKGERKSVADALTVTVLQALDTVTVSVDGFRVPLEVDLDVADYPALPVCVPITATVDLAAFTEVAGRVATAAGSDHTLPMLTAVQLLIADGELTMAATDRFRLTVGTIAAAVPGAGAAGLIPTKALLATLKRMSGSTLQIGVGDTTLTFTAGAVTTTLQLLEAEFPRFAQLLPTSESTTLTVTIDRVLLRRAVVKAAAMSAAKGEHAGVHLSIDEDGITVVPPAEGSSGPLVSAEVTGEGFRCGFHPEFFADALDTFDTATVTLHFTSAGRPVTFLAPGDDLDDHTTFKHLLMPIRLPG